MPRTLEAAVRRAARALGTRLRALLHRSRPGGSPSAASPRPAPEDAAFLSEVSETLRRLGASGDPAPPPPAPATAGARLRSAAAWLRRLREPIRRNEDAILAAVLLLGILIMVAHWRLTGDVHVPLRAPGHATPSARPDPTRREPPRPLEAREVDAAAGPQNTGSSR